MVLELSNFQGHSCTKIDVQGLTVITGKSNAGKSSIIRGLIWLMTNKPTGSAFIKHGTKEARVSFGQDIDRERGTKYNRYTLNGDGKQCLHFDAIKTDVPQAIANKLNIVPANIQRQKDVFFLIDLTPTAAGTFLDEVLHLTDISAIETESSKQVRESQRELTAARKDLEAANTAMEAYTWLDTANTTYAKITALKTNMEGWNKTILSAENEILRRNKLDSSIMDLSWAEPIPRMMAELQGLRDGNVCIIQMQSQARTLQQNKKLPIPDLGWTKRAQAFAEKWKELVLEWSEQEKLCKRIKELQRQGEQAGMFIKKNNAEMENLRRQLPKLCPTCGQQWEGK
jgi:hypothetical protein